MISPYSADEPHRWVAAFSEALDARDPARAAALFGDECFWRDLAAFTWNVKTLEGRDEIEAMLAAQLHSVGPTTWRVEGRPTVAGEVLEAWVKFETKLARGRSILRLRDGRAWTLLTAIEELKGFEERKGPLRPMGVDHGVYRREKNLAGDEARGRRGAREREAALLRRDRRWTGRHHAWGAAEAARCPDHYSGEELARRAIPGETATVPSCCTIRSGTIICRTSPSQRTGRYSRRRTSSATGSRCTLG